MEELSFDQLIINVHDWANDKGLIDPSFVKSQFVKVIEELGEAASAISKNKPDELIDGLGSVVLVTLDKIQLNVNVPANRFTFNPPAGAEVLRLN